MGKGNFEIVVPSVSIKAEPPVSYVDKVVKKKGTKRIAEEYLKYLYSKEGQEIVAKHFFRPSDNEIMEEYKSQYPEVKLVNIDKDFGGWQTAQKKHFSDGGTFDKIYLNK